ncbi:hypothetical protein [Leifsonia sp. NPDC077715]|uniref:hypothetical protein n=1 Tax=Leifsonia sp. NPDC077715 TaxID=3155539 RepID=UPI00342E30E4
MISTRRLITTVTITMLAFIMSGCALLGGIMTSSDGQAIVPPSEFSSKTREQTLKEALAQSSHLVQFIGGDWYDHGSPRRLYDPAELSRWAGGPCGTAGSYQYSIDLQQIVLVEDPLAKIELVREHWKSLGYKVRQIGPAETDEERLTHIYVDLPYGAGLGFHASTTAMTISTQSECIKEE